MRPVLLIDFGSTYTKLTAVDLDAESVLGTAASYTTVQTDINEGLTKGLALLEEKTGKLDYEETFACSSAAGGLRMVTSGLVPELTSEAAKLASLGAGAKIIGLYSFEMTEDDLEDIREAKPDIFLLVGGTDGGNKDCILHNAKMLATLAPAFPIVVAGNRAASRECERILAGCEVHVCPNVMPKFGVLNIEPTQNKIREIFLGRIVQAKGLSKVSGLLSDILMPTPSAVLQAMELLSKGCEEERGIGDLVGVDVGGATTDVYSMADGMPEQMNTVYKGLPEPFGKRTVEGDIGMRYSVKGILEAAQSMGCTSWQIIWKVMPPGRTGRRSSPASPPSGWRSWSPGSGSTPTASPRAPAKWRIWTTPWRPSPWRPPWPATPAPWKRPIP